MARKRLLRASSFSKCSGGGPPEPESFIEIAQEINGREQILSKTCINGKCTWKRDFYTTKLFISAKHVPKQMLSSKLVACIYTTPTENARKFGNRGGNRL
jgi:hypothetical protein